MKRLCILFALLCSTIFVAVAQNNEQQRSPQIGRGSRSRGNEAKTSELTVRAQALNKLLNQEVGNARWIRVIYRQLNLLTEQNAPLYYPVIPMNGSSNLFTTIFQLVNEEKIPAYKYLDGYEVFDEAHQLKFKEDILDQYYIMYETIPVQGKQTYVVNESDVPSADVKSFYVKEVWYFDQNNSVYAIKTIAICPLLTLYTDFGDQTSPMFWIEYEDLRPYVSNNYIMTSNINNAKTFTIDDYFRNRMFDGKIIKTENLLNQPLNAYCPTPDSMKMEQDRIEKELVDFGKKLWVVPDTLTATDDSTKLADKEAKKAAKKSAKRAPKEKTAKVEKPKTEKPKGMAPTRRIRRR